MSDRRISQLAELTTTEAGDYLPIVDISEPSASSKNRRITLASLFRFLPGPVGIGTANPGTMLDIRFPENPATDNGVGNNVLRVFVTSPLAANTGGAISLGGVSAPDGDLTAWGQIAGRKANSTSASYAGYLQFAVNTIGGTMVERGRFTDDGYLLVGCTAPFNPGVTLTPSGSGVYSGFGAGLEDRLQFRNSNGLIGSVSTNGSATSFNTSSDYRLKENVVAVTDGITRLQQLKPSRFNFIADPDKTVDGFIAHEVQDVVPEAITGEKDAVDADGNPVYQGIDQSKLVPLLTAALQEAVARIETLEAKLQ